MKKFGYICNLLSLVFGLIALCQYPSVVSMSSLAVGILFFAAAQFWHVGFETGFLKGLRVWLMDETNWQRLFGTVSVCLVVTAVTMLVYYYFVPLEILGWLAFVAVLGWISKCFFKSGSTVSGVAIGVCGLFFLVWPFIAIYCMKANGNL